MVTPSGYTICVSAYSPWLHLDQSALELHPGFYRELPLRCIVFEGNVQKPPIASHLKGF